MTEKATYESDPLRKIVIKFDALFNTIIRERMIQETISNYLAFIRSYMPPKEGDYYKFKGYPLIILQLNVHMTAVKKKKKKSRK